MAGDMIDWELCVLCQSTSGEKLVLPSKKTCRNDATMGDGYATLATNLKKFHDLGLLPQHVNLQKIDAGLGIEYMLRTNEGKWHKNCYSKYNNTHLERAKKRATSTNLTEITPVKTRRMKPSFSKEQCMFCDSNSSTHGEKLHRVDTENASNKIIKTAEILGDTNILSKVSGASDLMALDAVYHLPCLTRFHNRLRQKTSENKTASRDEQRSLEGLALIAVKQYIEEVRATSDDSSPIFKMSKLVEIYQNALKELNLEFGDIHVTRLKDRLLTACPFLQASSSLGKGTLISFKDDLYNVLRSEMIRRNYDSEALSLANATDIIRSDIFEQPTNSESVPPSLRSLVQMMLRGSILRHWKSDEENDDSEEVSDQAVNSISQLIVFHATKTVKGPSARRCRERETPVPKFLAFKLFSSTRSKDLIDITYRLGLSISYQRLQCILSEMSNRTNDLYHEEKVVCPPSLMKGIFTTASADNIDHNPTSTTAKTAFHGTAIAMMQHFGPTEVGTLRGFTPDSTQIRCSNRKVRPLPSDYANVQPVTINTNKAKCTVSQNWEATSSSLDKSFSQEVDWLKQSKLKEGISWSAYHARICPTPSHQTKGALLPVFTEQAHDAATMCHVMRVVMKVINHLNPGQIPVLTVDQPLYALCKQIQFIYPDEFGEDKIFLLLGSLHIEMDALRIAGQWLEDSGWVETLVKAEVITKGRAESILKVGHVLRSRYAHEVTAAVLFNLQQKAYEAYKMNGELLSFEEWRQQKCQVIPQFQYWDITLRLQLNILQLVRAIRTGNFALYKESLMVILPWCFALNHVHYARWLSVHIRDLDILEHQHPTLYNEFQTGRFTAAKTGRPFSCIGLDHSHEQFNAILKGAGGMIGLTEDPSRLKKWMLSAPDVATYVTKFQEEVLGMKEENQYTSHHKDSLSHNEKFRNDVSASEEVFEELGNPFLEESLDLYNLETKRVAMAEMINTVRNIESKGEELFRNFINDRLVMGTVELMDTIKRQKNVLFSTRPSVPSKAKSKLAGLKNNCALFMRLFIACQHRQGDLEEFFTRENQPLPPSLTVDGEARSCKKSDLIKCLLNTSEKSSSDMSPKVQAKIFDGGPLLHFLHPRNSITFNDYAEQIFLSYLKNESTEIKRIDVVWDRYLPESLKTSTRVKRGLGTRIKITPSTRVPRGWPNFLRDSDNKDELSRLLATYINNLKSEKTEFYSTLGKNVVTTSNRTHLNALMPCEHEEADSRILVHVCDNVAAGLNDIMIRSVDTDVVVLAVFCYQKLENLKTLWVSLGTGRNHMYLAAHEIAASLGPQKSLALPFFHAFTGCDITSSFAGKGKKSAFGRWESTPDATDAFLTAASGNVDIAKEGLQVYVMHLYDKTATDKNVDACRMRMFTKSAKKLPENIPPTSDALYQHSLRAAYQAQIWEQMNPRPPVLNPADWGWEKDGDSGQWTPIWITIPDASESVELIKCGCTVDCATSRCKCAKSALPCTQLCGCDALCSRQE